MIAKNCKTNITNIDVDHALRCISTEERSGVLSEYVVFPGFCDVHVHFRQPGFSYKETIKSGSCAAARGGFTTVCTMPNLNPVPDSRAHLDEQLRIIKTDALIEVVPYGSITEGEMGEKLSDMDSIFSDVVAFSDDGKGVQSDELVRCAMEKIKSLGKILVAHCEDNSLLNGGYIHEGAYASAHGHRGICSESEYAAIKRDIKLAAETGCPYHVCHISTKESVALIRDAKKNGIDITCETAPHYLVLDDGCLQEHGRFKMNPPLRSAADREALIEGLLDGTIDMIATDHAPHSAEEKSRGLEKSAFGIVGLETAFPVMYTHFVKNNILSLKKLVELMCDNPRKRFGLKSDGDFTVWDLNAEYVVDPNRFATMGRATPFEGHTLFGECVATFRNRKEVYNTFRNLEE